MKKLIIILAIVLCAVAAGAQSNPLFAPFQDSLRLAVPLAIAPAPALPSLTIPDPTPAPQSILMPNGRLAVAIPLGNEMYYFFGD